VDKRTSDDLEAAQIEANEIPPGPGIPSAGERWRGRKAVAMDLRAAVQRSIEEAEAGEREGWVLSLSTEMEVQIKRTAIRRALVAYGLLKVRRRWIPLPKKLLGRAKIS
jgi:hypothetical protein